MKPIQITFNRVAVSGALLIALYIFFGGSLSNKQVAKRKSRKKGSTIPGLANVGNTCFLNCILQAVASCPSFLKWLQLSTGSTSSVLIQSLEEIVKVLSEGTEGRDTDALGVLRALRCHGWVISAEEQDAHELFHALTSTLHDEIMQVRRQANSLLNVSWVNSEHCRDVAPTSPASSNEHDQSALDISHQSELAADPAQSLPRLLQENVNEVLFPKQPLSGVFQKDCIATSIISKVSSSLRQHRHLTSRNSSMATMESPFKGHLVSQLQCNVCGFKNAAHWSTFESLSLSLPSSPWSLQKCDLYELLDAFVRPECVTDVMCDGCSKDNNSPSQTNFSKKLTIGKLPNCLCIHIQRTVWLENGCAVKRKDFVAVPEFLNMDPYTYTVFINHQKLKGGLLGGRETSLMLPILPQDSKDSFAVGNSLLSSQVKGDLSSNRSRGMDHSIYKLQAVVVHIGDVFSGHFVTYRRGVTNSGSSRDKWFYTSDIVVKEVSFEEVTQSNAYMIIYERLSL